MNCKDCECQRSTEDSSKTHSENKYKKKCGSCNYIAIAKKKYAAFQLLQKIKYLAYLVQDVISQKNIE